MQWVYASRKKWGDGLGPITNTDQRYARPVFRPACPRILRGTWRRATCGRILRRSVATVECRANIHANRERASHGSSSHEAEGSSDARCRSRPPRSLRSCLEPPCSSKRKLHMLLQIYSAQSAPSLKVNRARRPSMSRGLVLVRDRQAFVCACARRRRPCCIIERPRRRRRRSRGPALLRSSLCSMH